MKLAHEPVHNPVIRARTITLPASSAWSTPASWLDAVKAVAVNEPLEMPNAAVKRKTASVGTTLKEQMAKKGINSNLRQLVCVENRHYKLKSQQCGRVLIRLYSSSTCIVKFYR